MEELNKLFTPKPDLKAIADVKMEFVDIGKEKAIDETRLEISTHMVQPSYDLLNVAHAREAAAEKKSWAEESPALKDRYDKFITSYKEQISEADKQNVEHKKILADIQKILGGKFPPTAEMEKWHAIGNKILLSQNLTHKMTPNFEKLTAGAQNKTMNESEANTILTELENDLSIYRGYVSTLGSDIITFRLGDVINNILEAKKSSGGGTRKRHHSYPLKHTFKNRRG